MVILQRRLADDFASHQSAHQGRVSFVVPKAFTTEAFRTQKQPCQHQARYHPRRTAWEPPGAPIQRLATVGVSFSSAVPAEFTKAERLFHFPRSSQPVHHFCANRCITFAIKPAVGRRPGRRRRTHSRTCRAPGACWTCRARWRAVQQSVRGFSISGEQWQQSEAVSRRISLYRAMKPNLRLGPGRLEWPTAGPAIRDLPSIRWSLEPVATGPSVRVPSASLKVLSTSLKVLGPSVQGASSYRCTVLGLKTFAPSK